MSDYDHTQQAIFDYQRFLRKELVKWFTAFLLLVGLLILSVLQLYSINSRDINRDYHPVDKMQRTLQPTRLDKPHASLSKAEVMAWTMDNLKYCMTFDYINYAIVSNYCNTNVFSLNPSRDSQYNNGQLFYRALEKSELIKTLISNKTSMTIEYIDVAEVTRPNPTPRYYTYNYQMTFKIIMQGQKLDAPIIYDVATQRMGELQRSSALGIRSVISNE
ncbi:DotI/IcmL/TraM family protein [Vibrio anguillarum]|uniref:Uncharacterized protein n=1 Tax=Vibrio anguillarum TaxID=55601 RepID=A0ABR9Z8Q8_VIBAN|nr:DotI/IcmL/TraM family protein [Vibrio anguillarum]MBF4374377.1 hypothetical protein [Vibrio anguillarum]